MSIRPESTCCIKLAPLFYQKWTFYRGQSNLCCSDPATRTRSMDHSLSRRAALLLFAAVVLSWGLNWAVTKILVQDVAPFWATTIRSAIGSVVLLALLLARG